MKKTLLLLLLLSSVLVLNACVGLQTHPAYTAPGTGSTVPSGTTPTGGVGTTGTPDIFQMPEFAKEAYLWEATAEAGKTVIDSNYRIIVPEGNADANLAAQVLRLGLNSVVGSSLSTTNDKLDNNPEREKEILLGYITNRDASGTALNKYADQFASYTNAVGSFYIGAKDSKIMILAKDDASLGAAVAFFIKNYATGKDKVALESDLNSLYFFDKHEYQTNRLIVCLSQEALMKNIGILNLKLNDEVVEGFSTDVTTYAYDIERSAKMPVISADFYSPYVKSTITQPSADNNWTGSVSVASADGSQNATFSVKFTRLEYDTVGATLHKLKDGATGAISLVQDDGFKETTEIMLEVCKQYGLKFNIALTAKSFGDLEVDGNGKYVYDENGNYKTVLKSNISWWQNIIADNSAFIEITSHSITHSSWGLLDENVKAEIIGSQQILRDAFPGQRVLTFAYPGFSSDSRDAEYAKAREFLVNNYVAARFLSTGKNNPLINPNFFSLECCSLYYNDPATWGTGASNNDGWMMNSILNSCSKGGWVVTMNHMIQQTNSGLSNGSMTIDRAMFEHVVVDYIVPNVQKGVLWNGFFAEVAQYVTEYNSANLVCRTYEDGVILVDLTDEENDEIYDYALTIDIPVDETWNAASFSYTARDGRQVQEVLTVSTAADGSRYVRVQLVPDCGTATLTRN